mgnify:CR=1 FL=1
MEMTNLIDMLLGVIVAGVAWFLVGLSNDLKRLNILVNRTREDYATKTELRDDMDRLMEALHRLEDKLDKVLQGSRSQAWQM